MDLENVAVAVYRSFPDQEARCCEKYCSKVNFIPMKCDACYQIYCKDHLEYEDHDCSERMRRNYDDEKKERSNQVPLCPQCSQPVPLSLGSDPEELMFQHLGNSCKGKILNTTHVTSSSPPPPPSAPIVRCCVYSCNKVDFIPMKCDACYQIYCKDHLQYEDHKCADTMRRSKDDEKNQLPTQVPLCPQCSQPVPLSLGADPEELMSNHMEKFCKGKILNTIAINSSPTAAAQPIIPPPPSLDIFSNMDSIQVKQEIELLEIITGFETNNRYKIYGALKLQKADAETEARMEELTATEDTPVITRCGCGDCRPATIVLTNSFDQKILTMQRNLRMQACCFPCCLQKMDVFGPQDELLGSINQMWSLLRPNLRVKGEDGKMLFKIRGPNCPCGKVSFNIYSEEVPGKKVEVGSISKDWGGTIKEFHTDADDFGIIFDKDLSVKEKALLFAALFLIDYMYFEESPIDRDWLH